MNPEVWGPNVWASIHYIALGYPDKPSVTDTYNYKTFYETMQSVLPCKVCSEHFAHFLKKTPIDTHMTDRRTLFNWTVKAHNNVNRYLGKPEMTEDVAWNYYTSKGALKEGFMAPYKEQVQDHKTEDSSSHTLTYALLAMLLLGVAALGAINYRSAAANRVVKGFK
jgi:hypothetical protein